MLASAATTSMPQIGSIAVAGGGDGDAAGAAAGLAAWARDELGEDRDGDLRRSAGADGEPGWGVDRVAQVVGDVERLQDRGSARRAGDERDVPDPGLQRGAQGGLLVVAV